MLLDVGERVGEQVGAGVDVGEVADADAVGRVQLRLQELAAGVPHGRDLKDVGRRQQRLPTVSNIFYNLF